jgi:hypothetical protein
MAIVGSLSGISSEVESLRNCNAFEISITAFHNFHILALLWELNAPLQGFVHCCTLFGLGIASADSFRELRGNVTDFYSLPAGSGDLHTSLLFFQQLLVVFGFQDVPLDNTLLPVDILIIGADGLNTIMPRLSFLSNLSHYIELWKYVGERQWFGDEGLKRFYNEYGNVTNVLLGNSASYEMALLDILEPIVRLYSAVGKVKEALTIKDLLEKFDNESDILSAINEESFKNNLPQVHARLSEIKEWFSNGVDEVAGSHSHYAAALSTGVYTIEDLDANYFLSLRFSLGSSGDLQLLRGNELEQFILQLSLIQNENVATANDMQLFIDQYHILMKYIKESVELKNMLDENMQGFGTWLSQLSSRYKVSLLYWTEEIYAMFGSLKASPANCNMLMEFTSRLHPLWSTT